jgi:hypothetical protein
MVVARVQHIWFRRHTNPYWDLMVQQTDRGK